MAWALTAAAAVAADSEGDCVTVTGDGRPLLEYRQTPNPNKVYVSKLYTPSGVQVLLDSPPDHVHHHGLMYAVDADTAEWWMDGQDRGVQKPRGACRVTTGKAGDLPATTLSQALDWVTAAGVTVLSESRRITACTGPGLPATLLTWTSGLGPAGKQQDVRLFTARTYVGLGFRFPKSMDNAARFTFPDGKDSTPVRNTEKVTRDRWCACTGPVEGKTVTVAMFAHPDNFRHPCAWFTMSDSLTYMTATLNLYRQPLLLRAGTELELCYGVAAWDGEPKPDEIEALYRRWLTLAPKPAVYDAWEAAHVNVALPALGATATASSSYGPEYGPEKAFDGKWALRETDKWNSAEHVTPHYLRVDLGQVRTIDGVRLHHEGIRPDGASSTTADFRIQASLRPWGPWEDCVPPVRRNTAGVTEHRFKPVAAQYVRLLIETGEQGGGNAYGRIFEMEVFSPRASAAAGKE